MGSHRALAWVGAASRLEWRVGARRGRRPHPMGDIQPTHAVGGGWPLQLGVQLWQLAPELVGEARRRRVRYQARRGHHAPQVKGLGHMPRTESEEVDDEQRGTRRLHTPHDGLVLISDLATARRSSVGVCGRADKGRSAAFPAKGAAHRVVRDKGDDRTTLPLQLACEQEQRLHVTARAEGDEEDSGAGVLWGQLPGEAAIDTLDGHRVASRCRGEGARSGGGIILNAFR
eukprot:scaffold43127_cov62-Phaeocystis_antarctica.AAC.2